MTLLPSSEPSAVALAGADAPARPVARLLRYTGPRAAYLGAIGVEVAGGIDIAGRVVPGRGVPPVYQMSCGRDVVATCDTWEAATADLALRVPADLAAHVLDHVVSPAGFEVSDGCVTWRLEPV